MLTFLSNWLFDLRLYVSILFFSFILVVRPAIGPSAAETGGLTSLIVAFMLFSTDAWSTTGCRMDTGKKSWYSMMRSKRELLISHRKKYIDTARKNARKKILLKTKTKTETAWIASQSIGGPPFHVKVHEDHDFVTSGLALSTRHPLARILNQCFQNQNRNTTELYNIT